MKKRQETLFEWKFVGIKPEFISSEFPGEPAETREMRIYQKPNRQFQIRIPLYGYHANRLGKEDDEIVAAVKERDERYAAVVRFFRESLKQFGVTAINENRPPSDLTVIVVGSLDQGEQFCDGAIRLARLILDLCNNLGKATPLFLCDFKIIQRTWVFPRGYSEWILLRDYLAKKHGLLY